MPPPSAVEELSRNADALRALARDLLGDASLADDALQEAALTALSQPPAPHTSILGWLRAMVKSRALDLRRRERRCQARERHAARPEADFGGDPVDTADKLELQRDLLGAVGALDEPYRSTIWWRYYEHLSPKQIAARTGVPLATVKMRLWRALQLLRRRLDRRHGRQAWLAALAPLTRGNLLAPAAAFVAGASLMHKHLILAAAVLLLLLFGAAALSTGGPQTPPPAVAGPLAAAAAPDESAAPGVPAAPPTERSLIAAAPATTEPAPYGSLRVQVRFHDGAPAAGVALVATAEGEPQRGRTESRLVADAHGIARAASLHAGNVALVSDRGGNASATVRAGTETSIEFALPRGLDVRGRVVDGQGQPVAGARLFVASGRGGGFGGHSVGVSGSDGTFCVRSVDPLWSIGALAGGFAPSELVDLEQVARPKEATEVAIVLQLRRAGAAVDGCVRDANGKPVAGALVAIGSSPAATMTLMRMSAEQWSPDTATTDADGAFACDAVEPGRQPVAVQAAGFALWSGEVDCPAGESRRLAIVLQRGVTVGGSVRDADGAAVAGATIQAFANAIDSLRMSGLRPGSAFPWPETRSDAAGNYELCDVPPGALHLLAALGNRVAREECTAAAGENVAWDPVLRAGGSIRVRVVDADGKAAAADVEASAEAPAGGAELRFGKRAPDDAMVVVLPDCAEVPYTVSAEAPLQAGHAWRTGVLPNGPEVVLQLPARKPLRQASVRGRFVDRGGRLPAGQEAMVWLAGAMWRNGPLRDGAFAFRDVPPGRYGLQLRCLDRVVCTGPGFELLPGQDLDLGDLLTMPAANLRVVLRAPAGVELGKPSGRLDHGPPSRELEWDGIALHAENVEPGVHRLTVRGPGWFAPPRDLELIAGQDNQCTVDVAAGAPCPLQVAFPFPDRWRIGGLRVRDANGQVIAEYIGMLASAVGLRPIAWAPCLPAGSFVLEATTDSGHAQRWTIGCPDGAQPVPWLSMR